MGAFSSLDISAAALDVYQVRLQIVAANLANAETTRAADGVLFRPLAVTVHSFPAAIGENGDSAPMSVASLPRPVITGIGEVDLPTRSMYDPGHPDADARGFVIRPGADPVGWTLELMAISRNYEANLRAFDITRNLMLRTLELGNQR